MKKLFALLLAVVMLLSLAACNNEKPVETKPQETQGPQSTDKATEPSETQGPPVTVKWMTIHPEPADADIVIARLNELLLERYNLQVEFEWIATGEYNDRTKLASTSGEDYDIVYTTYVWLNKFEENLSRGAFYDLTDILDEYGAAIKEQLVPAMWDVATVSGRIYAIPNQQASGTGLAFYVQKDLADKYGLDPTQPVTSGDDIEWFLQKIVENEEGIYPIHIPSGAFPPDYEAIAASNLVGIKKSDDPSDGIEVFYRAADFTWAKVNDWYNKGYLHPEFHMSADLNTIKAANQFAVFTGNAILDGAATISISQGEEYYMIPYSNAYLSMTAGSDTMLAINANSKDPVAALRLINAFWEDEEIFNTFMFGLEGVHYNKIDATHVELIEGSTWDLYTKDWAHGNQFNRWLMPGEYENKWAETYATNANADVSPIRGFTCDLTDLQVELTQISAVFNEYKNANVEDNWEELAKEYEEKLKAAGIETVVKVVQEQLDAWLASK